MTDLILMASDIEQIQHATRVSLSASLAYENSKGCGYNFVSITLPTGKIVICGIMTEKDGYDDFGILGKLEIEPMSKRIRNHVFNIESPKVFLARSREDSDRKFLSGFAVFDEGLAIFAIISADFSIYLDFLLDGDAIASVMHRPDIVWEDFLLSQPNQTAEKSDP